MTTIMFGFAIGLELCILPLYRIIIKRYAAHGQII